MKTKKDIEFRIKLFMSNIRKGYIYDACEVMLVDDIYQAINKDDYKDYTNTNKLGQCLTCSDNNCCDDFCNG